MGSTSGIIVGMCARRGLMAALSCVVSLSVALTACGSPERTGSAFCAQLGKELPDIAQAMATAADVSAMVDRYERLLDRAPLSIEDDLATFTDVLKRASRVDATDTQAVQELADATYAANKSALNVRDWVKDTCAVDISTGMNIEPRRRPAATTTSTSPSTTAAP